MDIKQLKYFVVSTEMNSFSAASKVLYTTQSNISKSIQALEQELGSSLFKREARGITLTPYGKRVYQYAVKILDNIEELENISKYAIVSRLHISTTPSSWFASRFCEFYNEHYDENYRFHIRNSSHVEILNRVEQGKDELGFLYVFDQDENFSYLLKKKRLKFIKLCNITGMLYLGKKNPYYGTDELTKDIIDDLRYIQMYQDEFVDYNWSITENKDQMLKDKDIAVITNSDYIMEKMLNSSALANISSEYLICYKKECFKQGYRLHDHNLVYGVVVKDNEPLSLLAEEFLKYIKQCLKMS